METITITVDNLIRNYCNNFLSYLYISNGWKRTMLDLGKEKYIESYIDGKDVRILVTNSGKIMLTCYNIIDVLNSMEHLLSEFEYGRMGNYCVYDDKVNIKINFITRVELNDFYYSEKGDLIHDVGTISLSDGVATLKYDEYEKRDKLMKIVRDIYFCNISQNKQDTQDIQKFEMEEINEVNENKTDYFPEFLTASFLFLSLGLRLFESFD